MYIPIDDVNGARCPAVLEIVTGVTGLPFTVIVAFDAPAGALISTPATPFPVGLALGSYNF